MNDHNLDDLIIDTIAPKNNKSKSLLTIIALLIVVLIVGIILTKTLLKSPDNNELAFEENLSEMIAPELQLQEPKEVTTPKVAKPEEETSLASIIEEKVTAPKAVEEPKVEVEEVEVSEPTIVEKKEVSAPIVKKPVPKPVVTKPVVKETSKPSPKPKPKPKTEVKKPVSKPTATPVSKPTTNRIPKASTSGKYYVQVGSFKENPSKRFLSVIKSSGFKYHVSGPDRTGYKKLLIGPYKTRADVDKARDVVRDRIHKSAFVVEK